MHFTVVSNFTQGHHPTREIHLRECVIFVAYDTIISDESLCEGLPSKPPALYGREELVQSSVEALCQGRHIAFTGPGGIGKSSIAKTVLHDNAIRRRYGDQRYFARFDNLRAESITFDIFLDRIAQSLRLPKAKPQTYNPDTYKRIVTFLLSRRAALLVLDHAETFLEAQGDAGLIADAVDDFGALSQSVQVVLTSRNGILTKNLPWTRVLVPVLDPYSARQAFLAVYKGDISSSPVDAVLTDVGYRPLSIRLLASAALRNEWSAEDLVDKWQQHTPVSSSGTDKYQGLESCIKFCMSSPIIREDKNALGVAQAIAFLPQGIHGKKLRAMFPSVGRIERTTDLLCELSLAYRNGDFVTMLSPIRLYITANHLGSANPPYQFPFLQQIRSYYVSLLKINQQDMKNHSNEQPQNRSVTLIPAEDANVERLIVHDIVLDQEAGLQNCVLFTQYLICNPRISTGLGPILLSGMLSDGSSPLSDIEGILDTPALYLSYFRPRFGRNQRISASKALCLYILAGIASENRRYDKATVLAKAACSCFSNAGFAEGVSGLLNTAKMQATVYWRAGMFEHAENLSWKILKLIKWVPEILVSGLREKTQISIAMIMCRRGKVREASKHIAKICQELPQIAQHPAYYALQFNAVFAHGYISLCNNDNPAAQRYLHQVCAMAKDPRAKAGLGGLVNCLCHLSEALRTQSAIESDELLNEALDIGNAAGQHEETVPPLFHQAARAADVLDFETARKCIDLAFFRCPPTNIQQHAILRYVSARTELFAANYPESRRLFISVIGLSNGVYEVGFKARSLRALGEIALLEQAQDRAEEYFLEAATICKLMGIHPMCLCQGRTMYELDNATYPGWKLFYESRSSKF